MATRETTKLPLMETNILLSSYYIIEELRNSGSCLDICTWSGNLKRSMEYSVSTIVIILGID